MKRKTNKGTIRTDKGTSSLRSMDKAGKWLVLFLLISVMGLSPLSLQAQCSAENTAFLSGEQISYDLMFNWKFIWIKVGYAELTTDKAVYEGKDGYCFRLKSHTSKRADFFFKMRDTLTCHVTDRLEPQYFCKAAEEGKRHTRDEAWFSYRDGVSHVKQRRTFYKPADRQPQEMEYEDSRCIFDMLSILGQARSWNPDDYKVGDKIHFPMATGRRVEQQTLIYRGIENVESKDGNTYRCLVFSFVEYVGEKKEEKEVITFFISDDDNHLPIRLDMYLSFGSAKAFLTGVRGNRYPLDCIVEK